MCFFCGYTFPNYLSINNRKLCVVPNYISNRGRISGLEMVGRPREAWCEVRGTRR